MIPLTLRLPKHQFTSIHKLCIRSIHKFNEKKATCEEKCPTYKIPEIPKPIESNVCSEWKPEIVEVSANESHIAGGHVSTAMLCAQRLCDRNLVRCNFSTVHEDESCKQVCEETEEKEKPKKHPCPKKKKKRGMFLKLFLSLLLLSVLGLIILCPDDETKSKLNDEVIQPSANENNTSEQQQSTRNNK